MRKFRRSESMNLLLALRSSNGRAHLVEGTAETLVACVLWPGVDFDAHERSGGQFIANAELFTNDVPAIAGQSAEKIARHISQAARRIATSSPAPRLRSTLWNVLVSRHHRLAFRGGRALFVQCDQAVAAARDPGNRHVLWKKHGHDLRCDRGNEKQRTFRQDRSGLTGRASGAANIRRDSSSGD
jgi:hypothetical protein